MLSPEIENLLLKLLLTIVRKEKQVEINRQNLSQNIEFDIFQIYSYLDKGKKNCIDSLNLLQFLHRNGIHPKKTEIDFLILFYDENNDKILSYNEFLNMILPNNNMTLRQFAKRNIGLNNFENEISHEVEILFVKLLEREIDLIRSVDRIINEIKGQCDFDLHNIYHLLIGHESVINKNSLKNFFNKHYVNYNESDIQLIMKRLDFNKDEKIEYEEFHKLFCFNEPYCRCLYNTSNCYFCNPRLIPNGDSKIMLKDISPPLNINYYEPKIECFPEKKYINFSNNNCNDCNKFNKQYNINNNIDNYSFMSTNPNDNSEYISKNLNLINLPERYSNNNNNNINDINYNQYQNNNINPNIIQNNYINSNNNLNQNENKINPNLYKKNPKIDTLNNFPPCNPNIYYCTKCNNLPCICFEISYKKAEDIFIQYIKECINIESKIEKAKIDLSLKNDFNVEDAFKIFEMDDRRFISDSDLIYGLKSFEIYPSNKDIQLMKRRVNVKKTENILFSHFFDLVVPFEKDYRDIVERRKCSKNFPQFNKANIFLERTKKYFSNLINLIIECENKIENLRSNLNDVRRNVEYIFQNIDKRNLGYINDIDLNNFLKLKEIYINNIDNCLLFIRLDKSKDGKVECWELNEELEMTN